VALVEKFPITDELYKSVLDNNFEISLELKDVRLPLILAVKAETQAHFTVTANFIFQTEKGFSHSATVFLDEIYQGFIEDNTIDTVLVDYEKQ